MSDDLDTTLGGDDTLTVSKADIAEAVHQRVGFPKRQAAQQVDRILEFLKQAVIDGESIKISGFGVFNVREKQSRIGRNPKTLEEIVIQPRRVVTFRVSSLLKKLMNP